MVCRLCGFDEPTIRSHIIPESLYPLSRGPDREPMVIVSNDAPIARRSPTGIYDPDIVCQNCERRFAPWDDYAQRLFKTPIPAEAAIAHDGNIIGWQLPVEYSSLKLFFISLLWRAHTTKQFFFTEINVGPFAARLREMILSADPGPADEFSVVLDKFDDHSAATAILHPFWERQGSEGVRYYRFYLAGYVAGIKVDRQRPPDFLRHRQLSPNEQIMVWKRQFRGSPEHNLMLNLVHGRL